MKFGNGDYYQGQFLDDQKNGVGKFYWEQLKDSYDGEWENDKRNGQGTYIWQNGD